MGKEKNQTEASRNRFLDVITVSGGDTVWW